MADGTSTQPGPMLRSGIIGLGRMAWGYDGGRYCNDGRSLTHASCLARHPHTELVAGYDPAADQRAAFSEATGVPAVASLDALFAAGLDLVTIASPSQLHADHVRAAIEADVRFIWLEKPPTLTLEDHRQILALAEAAGARIAVNYPRRFMPQYDALAARTRNHAPTAVQVDYSRSLTVNGVHLLDQIGMLFPERSAPELEWVSLGTGENVSFAFTCGATPVIVSGLDLPYHCIDLRTIDEEGRASVIRGGLEAWFEPTVDNSDYPGFRHLGARQSLVSEEVCRRAMHEASYACLVNLVDEEDELLSSLRTSLFAAELLSFVDAAQRS